MLSPAVLLAAVLAAPTAPAAAPATAPAALPSAPVKLSFPAPHAVPVTEATKCDSGTVIAVDAEHARLQGLTKAGPVTYVLGPTTQVFAADGKPADVAAVANGARYRAYYVVDGGAKLLEVDLVD